jgi:methylglyoxal/glyoxal reductase
MNQTPVAEYVLNNKVKIPALGLGLYQISSGGTAQRAIECALEAGYRHFDTAAAYGNERDLGRALAVSGIPREELFVTTKLWNSDHGYDAALKAFEKSRSKLRLDYIDLYLIHWPVQKLRSESWRALLDLYDRGLCRAIGVSNYTINHLRELLGSSPLAPAINQVEFSPFLYQKDLLEFCNEHGILMEAYSPLTQARKLKHPALVKLSKKYGKTPAQLLIRWALEHKLVVIPKSARCERIKENAAVFDFAIAADDMAALDGLDEGFRTCWDPSNLA